MKQTIFMLILTTALFAPTASLAENYGPNWQEKSYKVDIDGDGSPDTEWLLLSRAENPQRQKLPMAWS